MEQTGNSPKRRQQASSDLTELLWILARVLPVKLKKNKCGRPLEMGGRIGVWCRDHPGE
jgi:hypothetical protein